MPDPIGEQLRAELMEVNRRLADRALGLEKELTSDSGRKLLGLVWAGVQPDRSTPAVLRAGAKAFVGILDMHPAGDGPPLTRAGLPIFAGTPGASPTVSREAGQILAFGSLYFGVLGFNERPRTDRLFEVMGGADVVNQRLRAALLNVPFGPESWIPPNLIDMIQEFAASRCFAGVGRAMAQLGTTLQGASPRSHANGITRLTPAAGCSGHIVTIEGSGFGASRPADTTIYFPTKSGSCAAASIARLGWSDTAIRAVVPPDVGTGCVGFVVQSAGGEATLAQAVATFVGDVTNCLGPLAAEPIRATYDNVRASAFKVPCPPCLPGNVNRFTGGAPLITSFLGHRAGTRAAGASPVADLQPGDMLELSWNTANATQVQIRTVAINGQVHELRPITGPLPPQGTKLVEWLPQNPIAVATFAWDAAYELEATNGCGSTTARVVVRMRLPPKAPPARGDFLWGVATAGRQVEGENTTDDWHIFTTDPQILQRLNTFKNNQNLKINPQDAGVALRHWAWGEFVRSVERTRALGLNAYRLSIEWSRIEPVSGRFDATALGNYQMMIAAIRAHGMEPIVVLNHLSLPAWVQTPPRQSVIKCCDPGASDADPDYKSSLRRWATTDTVDAYVRYVEFAVAALIGVRMWITFNEPLATTVPTGYLASVFPPGFLGDGNKAKTAIHNIVTAHARAFERIHAIQSDAQVGITDQWLLCKETLDPNATKQFVYYHQDFLINALVHGKEDRDIWRAAPRFERVLGIAEADWKPHLDFFGLQYYKSTYPYHFIPLASVAPWFGARADLDLTSVNYSHALLNDMGWEMNPSGLYDCLLRLKTIARFDNRDLPILIAENGTAEIVDHNRASYVTSHLEQMQRARRDGVPVIGYLHWSISDNWEWIDGYRPQARFGLFSVDLPSNAPVHAITDGALALSHAVAPPPGSVASARDRYGGYNADGRFVEHPTTSPWSAWQGTVRGRPVRLLLGTLGSAPPQPAGRQANLIGKLFHADERRWIPLDDVLWDGPTRTVQFLQRGYSVGGPVPERIFAGVLDQSGNTFSGKATESSGNTLNTSDWQVTRVPLAGMWQGSTSRTALITLCLSCPEGLWTGRVLRAMDWNPLAAIGVSGNGFTATESGAAVGGAFSPPNTLIVSPWNVSVDRLPDGLPF